VLQREVHDDSGVLFAAAIENYAKVISLSPRTCRHSPCEAAWLAATGFSTYHLQSRLKTSPFSTVRLNSFVLIRGATTPHCA
jgi:hypothetical protein